MLRPAAPLRIDANQQKQLEALVSSGRTPQKIALRAQIVLQAALGRPDHVIAKELGTTRPTVLLWRHRFTQTGVSGLMEDARRAGRKSHLVPEQCKPSLVHAAPAEVAVPTEMPSTMIPLPSSIERKQPVDTI